MKRLDGSLIVCYQGKTLTPHEAPPLAAALRAQAEQISEHGLPPVTPYSEPELPEEDVDIGERWRSVIWYEDSDMKRIHHELVKAGMERARERGKRIGRPRVSERPDFQQRFVAATDRIGLGLLSRRQGAKQLGIGYATLKRLLDAGSQLEPILREPATIEND